MKTEEQSPYVLSKQPDYSLQQDKSPIVKSQRIQNPFKGINQRLNDFNRSISQLIVNDEKLSE